MKKTTSIVLILFCMGLGAFAQGDAYIEFKLNASADSVSGTTKIYYRDNCTRSEINMSSPKMPGGGFSQVTLILKDKPQKAFILNEKDKTYTGIDLSNTSATVEDPDQYEVTLIGKEKVNGYECTHVKVKKKASSVAGEDIWVSTDIPNYKQYMSVKSKYTTSGLFKALAAKGALGFMVRIIVGEHGKMMQIDLVKAELRNNEASLFSLEGYKEQASPSTQAGAPDIQEITKKIQNMTPAERQQFIEELKKKQKQAVPTAPR